jgi:hypothetical protein
MATIPNPYEPPRNYDTPPLVAHVVPDNAEFVINFELTIDDVLAWNSYFHRHSPTMRRFRGIVLIVFVTVCVLFAALVLPQLRTQVLFSVSLAVAMTLFAVMYLGFPGRVQWSTRRLIRGMYGEGRNLNIFGPRQITLTPEFLLYSGPLNQSVWRWQGIERVVRDGDVLFIQASTVSAIIVPRRAFVDEAEFSRFAVAATEYQARAQSPAAAGADAIASA